jgi:hypothetical protein
LIRSWFALAIVLCIAAPARAERVTKVFPLAGTLPKSLRDAPAELTRVVAKSYTAEVAPTPIEDVAEILGCDLAQQACLASITEKVGADVIVFGRIGRQSEDIVVELTRFDPRKGEQQRKLALSGTTTDELSDSLDGKLQKKAKVPPPDGPRTEEPPPQPLDVTPIKEPKGQITKGTWGMIIGGGIGVGAGVGFLFAANNLKDDILRAPDGSPAEIARLRALEGAARTRLYIGAGLAVAGGTLATIGIVRAVIQKKQPSQEQPLVDVVPENGGASVFLNLRWP